MNTHQHPSCNFVLDPPKGDTDCRPLPILRMTDTGGLPVVVSFWKPTPEELAQLNAGGVVALHVWGRTHAPLYVGTENAS